MALSEFPISSNPTNRLAAQAYLPPPPVVLDHEAPSYNTLIARLAAEVRPSDIPEQIWVREVVDNIWEAARVRRLKVSTVDVTLARARLDMEHVKARAEANQ